MECHYALSAAISRAKSYSFVFDIITRNVI